MPTMDGHGTLWALALTPSEAGTERGDCSFGGSGGGVLRFPSRLPYCSCRLPDTADAPNAGFSSRVPHCPCRLPETGSTSDAGGESKCSKLVTPTGRSGVSGARGTNLRCASRRAPILPIEEAEGVKSDGVPGRAPRAPSRRPVETGAVTPAAERDEAAAIAGVTVTGVVVVVVVGVVVGVGMAVAVTIVVSSPAPDCCDARLLRALLPPAARAAWAGVFAFAFALGSGRTGGVSPSSASVSTLAIATASVETTAAAVSCSPAAGCTAPSEPLVARPGALQFSSVCSPSRTSWLTGPASLPSRSSSEKTVGVGSWLDGGSCRVGSRPKRRRSVLAGEGADVVGEKGRLGRPSRLLCAAFPAEGVAASVPNASAATSPLCRSRLFIPRFGVHPNAGRLTGVCDSVYCRLPCC